MAPVGSDLRKRVWMVGVGNRVGERSRAMEGTEEYHRYWRKQQTAEYRQWHDSAWGSPDRSTGSRYDHEEDREYKTRADNRSYSRHDKSYAESRSTSTWSPSIPPSRYYRESDRMRTRSPCERRSDSRGPGRREIPVHMPERYAREQWEWTDSDWERQHARRDRPRRG